MDRRLFVKMGVIASGVLSMGAQTSGFVLNGPSLIACTIGKSVTATIAVDRTGKGRKRKVFLSAIAPQGIGVSFMPMSGTPPFSSQMKCDTAANLEPGDYTIDVRGSF